MATLEQPANLSTFQQYRQACAILRDTSRATLPAWYQEALELDFQMHVLVYGASTHTYFYDRSKNEWSNGPKLSEAIFTDEEQARRFAEDLLQQVRTLKGTSVGVVVHVADEFATAELKPDLDNPAALTDLREAAFNSPGDVLDDSSIPPDQGSWRVLPYPASGSDVIGTTITISRGLESFVSTLRGVANKKNFPIVTQVVSAPLVAIMALSEVVDPNPGKPFVAVLQYPWFTALAFFNEHSDLRLVRTLQHRGSIKAPNLKHAIATTNASLEFENPDIFALSLGEDVDGSLSRDLKRNFRESLVREANFKVVSPIPEWAPEPMLSSTDFALPEEGAESRTVSHTFGALRAERWFLQDFLPPSEEDQALFPSRNEMKLLRFVRLGRIALAAIVILGVAWLSLGVFSVIRRPEWAFNESEAMEVKQRLVNLTQERQRMEHWNNLLSDRSKAWSSMESLARLFPADSGLFVKTYSHLVKPDSVPGQARVGFVKEWVISGMARDEALAYLNTLNTREGISAHFSEVAKVTGNEAYDPEPNTRTIVVNVRTQENPGFRQRPEEEIYDNDDTTYPFTFNLTVTQRFESTDPLAIAASTAP